VKDAIGGTYFECSLNKTAVCCQLIYMGVIRRLGDFTGFYLDRDDLTRLSYQIVWLTTQTDPAIIQVTRSLFSGEQPETAGITPGGIKILQGKAYVP
jgi:hypothetical protein